MIVAGPPRPRTPGDFLCGQKVTKKPLKKLRFLRIFLNDGGFLFTLRPVCLLSPISSLGRWQSNLRHHSLALWSSSLGSPPRSTILLRDYRATGTVRARLHFLSCTHGASAAQFGRDFYMEGRQAEFNILPILPGERAEVRRKGTILSYCALPGPSGPRGVGESRGGKAPLAAFW